MSNKENIEIGSNPLNEKKFSKILNDEITVKELKDFKKEMDNRLCYIIHKIAEETGRKVDWLDYDNENGEYSPGKFDSERYAKDVGYTGSFKDIKKERFIEYDDSFPTKWFIESFEEQLKEEINQYFIDIENKKQKNQEQKKENDKVINDFQISIKEKLTKEELCFIRFLDSKEIQENFNRLKKEKSINISKQVKKFKELNIDVKRLYNEYRKEKINQENLQQFDEWIESNNESLLKTVNKKKIN